MKQQNLTPGQKVSEFTVERIETIPELRSDAIIATHHTTKTSVLHLYNEDPNNLFCICFRTPVYNNTGVPHIIEHSVLSGSRKFPVKDPFKEMLRGSLQTFLNALTYPDKTIYPVSSKVEKDFFNLVDVYCDAVFNPVLSELTFAQEAWHFDLQNPNDPISIKGIVYNEMKGVFSDFHSHVSRTCVGELFPETTYNYDSGGEPEHIPSLTYEQFLEFHRNYYHPSNALIYLYGNIPTEKTLSYIHDAYLSKFTWRQVDSSIRPQKPWTQPKTIRFEAPSSHEDDKTASILVLWLFGSSADPVEVLVGRILSHYCFDNESSPLRRALVDSHLGEDLEEMSGFDADLRYGIFGAGLSRCKPEHTEAVRRLIFETLEREASMGLDPESLEGSIRQIEFRLREITDSGSFPYNLKLAERVFRSWLYDGDPLAHLCFEKALTHIKAEHAKSTDYFVKALRTYILDNPHHLVATIVASAELGEKLGEKTALQVAQLTKDFTAEQKQRYYQLTQLLLEEQKKPSPPEAVARLPRLHAADLPRENEKVPTELRTVGDATVHLHPVFTAGIIYFDIGFDIGGINPELLPYFPLYAELLTRCGAAGRSAQEMAKRISLQTGGIGASDFCSTRFGSMDDIVYYSMFHGKSLPERFDEMLAIFSDLFLQPHLDDAKLLQDILLETKNDLSSAVQRSGHSFALSHAAARLLPSKRIEEFTDGIAQLRFLTALTENKSAMTSIVDAVISIHDAVVAGNRCVVAITADTPATLIPSIESFVRRLPLKAAAEAHPFRKTEPDCRAFGVEINSSVNFVCKVWKLTSFSPESIARHYLLSRNLSTGYLWDRVRVEGGAYGGTAIVSPSHPLFACASYRDPNLTKTLGHFEGGLREVAAGLSADEVEKTIIGSIGRFDGEQTPHAKGIGETIAILCGRTQQIRQSMREVILSGSAAMLSQCAQELLDNPVSAITVLGNNQSFDLAQRENLQFIRERLLPESGANDAHGDDAETETDNDEQE